MFASARKIQQHVRGRLIYKPRGLLLMCERSLERALLARNDEQLRAAANMPARLGVTSKLVRALQESARKLVLEVLLESHVQTRLNEALEARSTEMLREAIQLAESGAFRVI